MKRFYLVILMMFFVLTLSACVLTPESKQSAAANLSKQASIGEPEDLDKPSPVAATQVNFSKTGNILSWDSKTESYAKEWTFLYDEPGALALNVKLIFNANSICNLGEGDSNCDQKFNNGDTVSVEGFEDGGKVVVTKLNYSIGASP
jgi:hypothetical protein